MQEVCVDHSELDRLVEKLAKSPQVIKAAKRQALEAAAPKLKAAVDAQIGGSGRVRGWQEKHVGLGGGYAAVRPKAKTWAESRGSQTYTSPGPKRYAVGYITNAVNNGHRTPRDKWGYRSSAAQIGGRRFYQQAQIQADQIAQETAQQVTQALMKHLEG